MDELPLSARSSESARPSSPVPPPSPRPIAGRASAAGPPELAEPPALPQAKAFWRAVNKEDDVALNKLCNQFATAGQFSALHERLSERDGRDFSMVMAAAHDGNVRICRTLIRNGAEANVGLPREGMQQTRGPEQKLTTPMALAAKKGHHQVVELLLRLSISHHDALQTFFVEREASAAAAEVLHVLARSRRVSADEWKSLLHHWIQREGGQRMAELVLFVSRIKPTAETAILAAKSLRPEHVRLLRDYGIGGNVVFFEEVTDSSSYYSSRRRQWAERTPLSAALEAHTVDCHEEVVATVRELLLAGARPSEANVQAIIGTRSLSFVRQVLPFCSAFTPAHLFTACSNGSTAILALLLAQKAWPRAVLEDACVRAQDAALPRTLTLLRAYQTVARLKAEQAGPWSWARIGEWLPAVGEATTSRGRHKASASELATQVELQEAEEHLALQMRLAEEVERESADTSLPVPGVSAVGGGVMTLFRGPR